MAEGLRTFVVIAHRRKKSSHGYCIRTVRKKTNQLQNMNIRIAIVLLGAFGLASCAKYMDNSQPGTADSAAMADSAHRALVQAAAQKLPGVWIRRVETEPGEQGFTLQADGKL